MLKYLLSFLLVMAFGWSGYFVSHNNLYPVALVNFKVITARMLDSSFRVAMVYYGKLKKSEVSQEDFEKEIKKATLDKLIENEIIMENVDPSEVESQLAFLLDQNKNQDLERGALLAYGLSMKDFLYLILRPQAALEILNKNLKSKNEDYSKWLDGKRKSARIYIFKN